MQKEAPFYLDSLVCLYKISTKMNYSTAASATSMCLRFKKRGISQTATTNFTLLTVKNKKS